MLKKLQKRFMKIVLCALCIIVTVQLVSVNVMNVYQRDTEVRNILYIIAENGGLLPNGRYEQSNYFNFLNPFKKVEITKETPYSTKYFVVKLKDNFVTNITIKNIGSIDEHTAVEYASMVVGEKQGYGFVDRYRYYYVKDPSSNSSMIVFLAYDKELEATFKLTSISLLAGLLCIAVLIFPIWLLSKKAMKPVEQAIAKQRQFITDAGHELKTPIAIISADAEVLEMCGGENEWVESIKNQTVRLDKLVKNLVTLSKLNEEQEKPKYELFNFSEAVEETAKTFETLAKTNNVEFMYSIASNVSVYGNSQELKQLISILCDNAVKYTTEGGIIKVSLYRNGKNVCLDMYNDCENVDEEKLERLFDRFYRVDSSRARETGGYGIGLSIAQIIVQRHRGKISAVSTKENSITFKIVLSSKPFKPVETKAY